MKTIVYPKKFTFPSGMSSRSIYLNGLDSSQIDTIKKNCPDASAVISTDGKNFDHSWDFDHCGESECAVINFHKQCDTLNLLLLGFKYYTRFPPICFVMVDQKHKQYDLIKTYLDKAHIEINTFAKIAKSLQIYFS